MKTTIISIASSLCAAGLVFFIMNASNIQVHKNVNLKILTSIERSVTKSLLQSEANIQRQLAALADVIAANNDFSLKILVERDRSSRTITDMAAQFLKPMNFSVLEITDSAYAILSSGHFPANAGNSSAQKAKSLTEKPLACIDNLMGTPSLTMQAKRKFGIADFSFYVIGGISIDAAFLSSITPHENVTLLLKNGNDYTGIDNIRSISEIKDNEIIINDKKYFASVVGIPAVEIADSLSLFILIDE